MIEKWTIEQIRIIIGHYNRGWKAIMNKKDNDIMIYEDKVGVTKVNVKFIGEDNLQEFLASSKRGK